MKIDITADQARSVLNYDPDTGLLTNHAGKEVGHKIRLGYRQVGLFGRYYKAHRLAWLFAYGKWPDGHIDHINGVRDDNRISNLRIVTQKQNNENRIGLECRNTSGFRGVTWDAEKRKWRAQVGHLGKTINAGYHQTVQEAAAAAKAVRDALFTHHTN